jgi:DNA ligase-1
MLLSDVVAASAAVASTRSRLRKREVLAGVIRAASVDELPAVVGFLSGEPRQGRVGVGYAAVYAVETRPAGEPSLTIGDLDGAVERIASISGPGSQAGRAEELATLLAKATGTEQDFIRSLLTGGLRQGALEGVVVDALADAAGVPVESVRRALMLTGDLAETAVTAVCDGSAGLATVHLQVLRAIRPMLASTADDVGAAVAKLGDVAVDWKLDGARIQVHRSGEVVRVFTRNLNDVTARLPEVVAAALELPAATVILDGEAMGLAADGTPLRFQETMSRFGAEELREDVPLHAFFFDILHLDGEDLIDLPLTERLERLAAVVPESRRIPSIRTSDPRIAAGMLERSALARHEGVMVKALDSAYEAGRRGSAWLKVKPVHTLDLVILAAEWGHGRRTGWLSNLHLGARDTATGEFVMLGKTFKGLTDEMLAWQTDRLLELEVRRMRGTVVVRPELVAEIALDGFLPSPRYPGGVALRFARVKGYRPDKGPEDVDTMEAVMEIYRGR